jgi:hypothetical protein
MQEALRGRCVETGGRCLLDPGFRRDDGVLLESRDHVLRDLMVSLSNHELNRFVLRRPQDEEGGL